MRFSWLLDVKQIVGIWVKSLVRYLPLILTIFGIVDFIFGKWKITTVLWFWFSGQVMLIIAQLMAQPVISLLLLLCFSSLYAFWRRLQVVAGEFNDDFSRGLQKWEFGGEGWKTEREGSSYLLSVSESGEGGITKTGFSWSDYEFSFETKVVSECSGWIIRAENRSKFFMIQLNMHDYENPRLRPHYRTTDKLYPWIALENRAVNLKEVGLGDIKKLEWLKVNIIVRGSEIDVYINSKHALHYFLPDPERLTKETKITGGELSKDVLILNYPIGRVGFRCAANEHAHFRKVRVKPLLD